MLADTVEGFINGLFSGVMRPVWAALAVFLGYLVWALPSGGFDVFIIFAWLFCTLSGFAWVLLGGGKIGAVLGFLIGLFAMGATFVGSARFIFDQDAKRNWFIAFCGATLFYAPIGYISNQDNEDALPHWCISLGIFLLITFCYWVCPRIFNSLMERLGTTLELEKETKHDSNE